jgi:hypothetical protein
MVPDAPYPNPLNTTAYLAAYTPYLQGNALALRVGRRYFVCDPRLTRTSGGGGVDGGGGGGVG